MCGLFGAVIRKGTIPPETLRERIAAAHATQAHRGPDMVGDNTYEFDDHMVVLGHQRLSILDLSENGKQPMHSHDKRQSIIFNGEIYNYKELAAADDMQLRTGTDTEVLLEKLSSGALPGDALSECNGMWAFAMLDHGRRRVLLSRDRAGIKPLYHTVVDNNFYFASEIKTLIALSGKKFRVNAAIVGAFIDQSLQDHTHETFFENVYSFKAGTWAELDIQAPANPMKFVSYWDPFDAKWSYDAPEETFRYLFEDAVKLRLRSDVPVGVTLSGGLDSSLITHEMKHILGHSNFHVLSAVFPGAKQDESHFVDIMAAQYGLSVSKVALDWNPNDTLDLMHKATWQNDTPLGSLSNVAFYLLMQQAHKHGVKVILSGQGADEMLCGYKKFLGFYVKHLVRDGRYLKAALTLLQFLIKGTVLNQFSFSEAKRYLSRSKSRSVLSDKVHYKRAALGEIGETLAERQWQDYRKYSVPYLTHYEDRMSMAFGREIRLPFLDYRLVEFLLNAPEELKLNNGWTKWLMRSAYGNDLPREIIWRKDKQGFVNPQEDWLKNELRPLVKEYFAKGALMYQHGLINEKKLNKLYDDYCAGKSGIWYRDIFNPLALEVWLRTFQPPLAA